MIFEQTTAAGIRYTSRVDANEECWAVFEATPLEFSDPKPVDLDDTQLQEAAHELRIALPYR